MKSDKVEKLIAKYLTNSITGPELDDLSVWFKNTEHQNIFGDFVKTNYVAQHIMGDYNTEQAKEQLLKEIKEDKKSVFGLKIRSVLKYAAIAVLFLALGYFFSTNVTEGSDIEKNIAPRQNSITLMKEDGSLIEISEDGTFPLITANGQNAGVILNGKLIYDRTNSSSDKYLYHTLKVPYGKKSKLTLSDGTKIDLNSGSSIRYPIAFMKSGKRQVFLDGEAFFDVVTDKKKPFVVNSKEMNVRALGTKFNVSSYSDDDHINTVLVEGSVGLYKSGEEFNLESSPILEPGYMATWEKFQKEMVFQQVDTEIYTCWVQGKIIFNRMSFKEIVKRLERKYNVEIINNNKQLGDEVFTASFDTETIEQVLSAFNRNYPINYQIKNNTIIIN